MGRPKNELKKIHAKKVRKAKEKLKLFIKNQLSYSQLTVRAKSFFQKGRKKKSSLT